MPPKYIVKDDTLPKAMFMLKTNPVNIPMTCLTKIEKEQF
jgi:hypothetical protein